MQKKYYYPEKTKEWARLNREKMRAYRLKWIEKNKELNIAVKIASRQKHRKKINERSRKYQLEHRWWYRNYLRQWRKKFPEKDRQYIHNRRARILMAEGTYSSCDLVKQMIAQNGRCFYCCKLLDGKWHVDHRIALSCGGENAMSNLCIACPTCNCRKQSQSEITFTLRVLME